MLARLAPVGAVAGGAAGAARRRIARAGARGHPADAEDRRDRRPGADGGARLQARPVLPAAELRDPGAAGRRHDPGDGGAGADRRRRSIGKQGLLSTIVLEMGGSSDLCALLKPGEPVILMGPTGTPTETPVGRDRAAGRRRARQCGAVLDRRGIPGAGLARPLFRRLQDASQTATRSTTSSTPPTVSCGAATRRRASPPAARRTAPLSATSSRRSRPMVGRARAGRDPAARGRPHHRDRLRRHDERGRRGAPGGLEALFPARTTARSRRSTRRCSA